MKPTDLRIGNLVQNSKNEIYKIYFGYDLDGLGYTIGIPLTRELLIKFGFKIDMLHGRFNKYFIGKNPITNDYMLVLTWLDGHDSPFFQNGHHKIEYVHQLQNLYFALTGEELNISIGNYDPKTIK